MSMNISNLRKLSIGTFGVSVLLHVAIFFLVGGWVLIQAVSPKLTPVAGDYSQTSEPTAEQPPDIPEDNTPALPDSEPSEDTPATVTTGMPDSVITANAPSTSFNLAPSVGVYVPGAGIPDAGPAGSGRPATDVTKKISVGKIFNTEISATKLGVIIDVSGSAHPYLPLVFADIQRSFSDAVIVLILGCGMGDIPTPKVLNYATAKPDPKTDGRLNNSAAAPHQQWGRTVMAQINWARSRGPKFVELFDFLQQRGNVYAINGGDVYATQFAFKELYKHNVDTIFWFSDLEDPIKDALAKQVTRELKGKQIKLIATKFNQSGLGKTPSMKYVEEMTAATEGKLTVVDASKVKRD